MKLRKIFATAIMALVMCTGMLAQSVSMKDVRIYINPGHGSWTANDRPMGTVKHGANDAYSDVNNDTTNFFESNTNIQKALAMLAKLEEFGVPFDRTKNQTGKRWEIGAAKDMTQNIVMSHVKAGGHPAYTNYTNHTENPENDYYNRALSEISAEVEFNDFDIFVSIHSNALEEGTNTNYPLLIYRGTNEQEGNPGSKAMCKAVWPYVYGMGHHQWTSFSMTRMCIYGDISFYGESSTKYHKIPTGSNWEYNENTEFSEYNKTTGYVGYTGYLGVIKHGVPGFLAEGYFHTYQPSRHRYMNWDVCHLEGVAYARGIADYFGWNVAAKDTKGTIYGIVRDLHERFLHKYYKPNAGSNDKFKPLNGVKVSLMKNGIEVATYTTDDEYNGAFVFNVTPGTYTIECSHPDYKEDLYSLATMEAKPCVISVTVEAAKCVYPEVFLEKVNYVPPAKVYENYPDSTVGKDEYKLIPYYELMSIEAGALSKQLAGKTIRRQIIRDNKLYVLALDAEKEANVYIFDIANNQLVKILGATATEGDILPLSDIALTAEGVLVGINKCNQVFDGASKVIAYKWDNGEDKLPTGEAKIWWTSNFAGNWEIGVAGESMIYDGTLEKGRFIYTGQTAYSSGNTRLVIVEISDSSYVGYIRNNQDGTFLTTLYLGETYNMTLSPNADDQIIFDSEKILPFEIKLNSGDTQVPTILGQMDETSVVAKADNASYFKYAGRSLMVAPDVNKEGKVAGLKLFDITDGVDDVTEISLNSATSAAPIDYKYVSGHGEVKLTFDDVTGYTTGATIELFLVVDGKVTKYTAGDFYSSVNLAKNSITGTANPYAYALSREIAGKNMKVKYSLNADATAVTVNIKDDEGEVVATAIGATTKGIQTVDVALSDLPDGNYTWEVVVDGAVKSNIERFVSHKFYHPSGLDIDNSFESGSFGTLFVCEGYNRGQKSGYVSAHADGSFGGGLYIFDPQNNQVLNKDGKARFYPSWMTNTDRSFGSLTCGADFGKVAIAEDGRIFVNRYNFEGDYYLYAESLEKLVADGEFTSLLAGKTMTDGIYFDEAGNYLAGPAQSFDVKGSGDDLKLIALSRNDKTTDATFDENRVVEYELGTGKELSTPTLYTVLDQKYTIAYDRKANLQYDNRGGVWYIQYRGTPSDSQPALIYVDENGEIKFFEGAGGKSRYQGALGVAPDGNSIVASSANGIVSVYEIIRAENGSVFLNESYRLTHNMGGSAYSAAWDIAGNFYLGNATNEVVQGYALPRAEAAVTKAARKYGFAVNGGDVVGVEKIEAEGDNAAVEYYNLQGVKVENPENGIFIKKQGNKVTKVVL